MGHIISSTFFTIIVIGLVLRKTKLKDKMNFIKIHKIMGSAFVVYMIAYSVIDYTIDKDASILLLLPTLLAIGYTGKNKSKIKLKYVHPICVVLFLITLFVHVKF